MRSWKTVGGFLIVALALLGPSVTLACTRIAPEFWTTESQDGRFEISLETMHMGNRSHPGLTLRDRRAGKVVWQSPAARGMTARDVLLSPSGRYLALVDSSSSEVLILGPNGVLSGQWSLDTHVTAEERRKLPAMVCGGWWSSSPAFEGDVLTLVVPTETPPDHPEPPFPGPVTGIRLRIDPATGHVTRDRPLPEKGSEVLLQEFQSARGKDARIRIARELQGVSQRSPRGSNPELRSFWLELLRERNPALEWELRNIALEGLSAVGTDEEIRGLLALPPQSPQVPEELLPEALMLLDRRFPEEAARLSLRVLMENAPSIPFDSLRTYAVFTLGQRPGAEVDMALQRALRDPAPGVRASALYHVSQRMTPLQGVELALPFLEDSEEWVQYRAAYVLCGLLRRAKGSDWRAAIDLLRRAEAAGKLSRFPEGLILLGAVADKEGDRARALALYSRGLEAMAAIPEQRGWNTYSVRLEAKLQLAREAKARGRQDEVRRMVHEILRDRSSTTEVCAPAPNMFLPFGRPEACATRKAAAHVAVELLTPSKPGINP